MLIPYFHQKARAAELNATRARKAAQMQSIDDEIPDLSGPVSLGMYKFTLRGRGKKYETHRLSELENARQKKEMEMKVTTIASPLSPPHPTFHLSPPTTLLSSQILEPFSHHHQNKTLLNDNIYNRLDNLTSDTSGCNEPGARRYEALNPSHFAADSSGLIRSSYSNKQSSQASGQAKSSFPLAQDQCSSQESFKPETHNSEASEPLESSVSPDYIRSNLQSTATIKPDRLSSLPQYAQANNSSRVQDCSLNQSNDALIDIDRQSPQVSGQAHPSFLTQDRRLDTSQKYSHLAKSLSALVRSNRPISKASAEATSLLPPPDFQPLASELYRMSESKVDGLLEKHRQRSQASNQANRSAAPKEYVSPQSSPLSDTLPTASFNLETHHWDPDLPEASMSAQTPTVKSSRGGHSSSQHSSEKSSRISQDARNTLAMVTTTKSGRPYTNPYLQVYPPPSTANQNVGASPSGYSNRGPQSDDAELIERQRKTRYVNQEEARRRVLEQAEQGHVQGSLDDPFQDQITHVQTRYGRNQPSAYTEYAASQEAYSQLPGYHYQPTTTTHASGPHASSFPSNEHRFKNHPDTALSPHHSRRSAYEHQTVVGNYAQIPGTTTREQRSGYEHANPRASVRLPAVKGTTEQQNPFLHEPNLGSLSLEDYSNKNAQDIRRRQTQGGIQPASGRVSHAVPIRDPAAYTGSGLSSRRNQEALRQNLDTVVASSQISTGAARTVMNDPHRDRQLSPTPSPTETDSTVTGSTLRAQAPSYESVNIQRSETSNPFTINSRPGTSQRQGMAALGGRETLSLPAHTSYASKGFERPGQDPETMYHREGYRSPAVPPGFRHDAAAYTKDAGLPIEAVSAGNAFMNNLLKPTPPKKNSQQRLEDVQKWFRHDPRDLSYAAAILPHEVMNRINAEQFPIEDRTPRSVSHLTDDSQDDDPLDRSPEAATPQPIGHGRPAGFATPPSVHGPGRAATQAPSSTFAGVASASDKETMEHSERQFSRNDVQALEAVFGVVYGNLMSAKNGPYDYLNHYCPPPAYAIDHNARNNDTLFDPQWFATAPPARVGRDPRREQGEYEDPTQGVSSRRPDHGRGDATRRDSGGRGSGGVRGWGRN